MSSELKELKAWADKKVEESAVKKVKAKQQLSWWSSILVLRGVGAASHVKLGGPEGVAFRIRTAIMDADSDGIVSAKEFEAAKDASGKAVDAACQMYLNGSVIATLVISVLVPVMLEPVEVHPSTEEYFSEEGIEVLQRSYYAIMTLGLMCSMTALFISLRRYLALTNWMPTLEGKIWYIETHGQMLFSKLVTCVLLLTGIAIPFGVCLAVGPVPGLCLAVGTAVTMLGLGISETKSLGSCIVYQQIFTKEEVLTQQVLAHEVHL